MSNLNTFDILILGSGPAGQKAAIQAAKAGAKVAIVEEGKKVGGVCVHQGTIPSKTLRESALHLTRLKAHSELFPFDFHSDVEIDRLTERMGRVISAHDNYIDAQLKRNHVTHIHGRASFMDKNHIKVKGVSGEETTYHAKYFIIATGSRPRNPDYVEIDHENIFDSDSLLSMIYLPRSMIVIGGGVIGSEYASIFANLGVKVTMIDRFPRPMGFLDDDLTDKFLEMFGALGGQYIANVTIENIQFDGFSKVEVKLKGGKIYSAEKLLCAAGRAAHVKGLDIEKAGVSLNENGLIEVDEHYRTHCETIYAAGDVIGPPSLASSAMEQGRRAVCHALGIEMGEHFSHLPMGIYSIPEISSVGLSQKQAKADGRQVIVGVSRFNEVARGQISGIDEGLLKIVADEQGQEILGVQIIGEGATELIHIGQMAMLSKQSVDAFIDNVFNFPTLAEAYRIAALDVMGQRKSK